MLCPFRKETHGLVFSGFVQARTEGLKCHRLSSPVFDLGSLPVGKIPVDFMLGLQRIFYNWSKKSVTEDDGNYRNMELLRLERTSGDHPVHLPRSKQLS